MPPSSVVSSGLCQARIFFSMHPLRFFTTVLFFEAVLTLPFEESSDLNSREELTNPLETNRGNDRRVTVRIPTPEKNQKAHVRKRNEVTPELVEELRIPANRYLQEYRKDSRKVNRLNAGDGTAEELKEFRFLREKYLAFRKALYALKNPQKEVPAYTPEALGVLREKSLAFRREFQGTKNRDKRARYNSGQVAPDEQARYDDLHKAAKEYDRWRRSGQGGTATPYTAEEAAELAQHRDASRNYQKKYLETASGRRRKARLEAGNGTPEQLQRFRELRRHYNAYCNIIMRHRRAAGKATDSRSSRVLEEVEELKPLHDGYRAYRREYQGPQNREKRERLQANQGKAEELERYWKLSEQYHSYKRIAAKHELQKKKKKKNAKLQSSAASNDGDQSSDATSKAVGPIREESPTAGDDNQGRFQSTSSSSTSPSSNASPSPSASFSFEKITASLTRKFQTGYIKPGLINGWTHRLAVL